VEEVDRLPRELMLRTQLALSLSATRGYAAPEVQDAYGRAREICTKLGNKAEHFPVLRGLCTFYIVRGELNTARDLAQQCRRIGEETVRPEYLIEGYTAIGYVLGFMGKLDEARSYLERAVRIYRAKNGKALEFLTPQDPRMACLGLLAIVCWAQGAFDRAQMYLDQSVRAALRTRRPFDLAYASCFAAMYENMRGESASAARHAAKAVEISSDRGFGIWLLAGNMHLAIAQGLLGNAGDAAEKLRSMLDVWQGAGAELNRPFFMGGLAEVLAVEGRVDEALDVINGAIRQAERCDEHLCTAALHRIRGRLLVQIGEAEGEVARDAFTTARQIARQQGAKGYEWLVLRSMATSPGALREDDAVALQALSKELGRSDVDSPASLS
jgi:predicted ATPase